MRLESATRMLMAPELEVARAFIETSCAKQEKRCGGNSRSQRVGVQANCIQNLHSTVKTGIDISARRVAAWAVPPCAKVGIQRCDAVRRGCEAKRLRRQRTLLLGVPDGR